MKALRAFVVRLFGTFGSAHSERMKEEYRDRRGLPLVESLMRDLRYGVRTLRRAVSRPAAVCDAAAGDVRDVSPGAGHHRHL